jgi:hypothetical protein
MTTTTARPICIEFTEGASEFPVPANRIASLEKLADKSEGVLGMHTTVTRPTRQWWQVQEYRPSSGPADPLN